MTNHILQPLRTAKHRGFIAVKRTLWASRAVRFEALTLAARGIELWRPYRYDPARYRRSFLVRSAPAADGESALPRRVFVLWTGTNELSANRQRNLDRLREKLGVPVEFVTPATLDRWVVEGHPLHPAYESLSLVHRSDYLRAYLLHHHGGGYADLKAPVSSWAGAFDSAAEDPKAWVTGFREISAASVVRMPGTLGADIALNHRRLVGTCAFFVRSHTPFTAEWLREVERRLDYYAPQAREHPGGVRGETVGYPVSWTDLLGKIFQPLQLKYLEHVRIDNRLLLDFEDYL